MMRLRWRPTHRPLRARHRRGQALVETALVAPILVMLLLGGAQVGSIAYNQVSLDSAAREGARAGAEAPDQTVISDVTNSVWYTAGNTSTYSYNCHTADFTTSPGANPVCLAVLKSAGYLGATASTFTSNPCGVNQPCVTITVVPPTGPGGLAAARSRAPGLRLVSAPQQLPDAGTGLCNSGNQAEVDGTVNFSGVSGYSTGSLSDSSNDPNVAVTASSPSYQFCVSATSHVSSQTITAQVGPASCGGYTGSVTIGSVTHGQVYTGQNITLSAEAACPTPTPTPAPTPTPSPTPTPTPGPTATPAPGPNTGCVAPTVSDSYYFKVTVTYPAPIFIPFLNNLFQTSSGVRMITASVTYPVDPCSMTE